jgi:hypothetical protein
MLVALGALATPVVRAADAGSGAPEHESRTMVYFSVPIGAHAHRTGPVLGLRLDRADTNSYSGWGTTWAPRAVPLMDLRLSMGRERDIRLNGVPLWTEGTSIYNAVDGSGGGTTPSRPLWKRPAFWIVTGTVVTVTLVAAEFADGYHRLNNSTAPQGADPRH